MSKAINAGDVDSEALRSLIMQRSFSKAGLAVNATTNTYTVTIGTKQTDDVITVNIITEAGLVTAEYTVLVGDADEAAVAAALELIIEALTGISSSATGAVITITPTTTTQGIVVSAAVTGTDPTTTATVAQTIIGSKGYKTANTFMFGIDGHTGSQTTQSNLALTGAVIPVSSFKWWLITIDTDGTLHAAPGNNGENILPSIPANQAVVGAIKVATSAAATFTPGVTSLNATGITDTYYDLSCIPKAGYPA